MTNNLKAATRKLMANSIRTCIECGQNTSFIWWADKDGQRWCVSRNFIETTYSRQPITMRDVDWVYLRNAISRARLRGAGPARFTYYSNLG